MQSDNTKSHSIQIFVSKLKILLQSSGLSFQDFILNLRTVNPHYLSKLEFFRIVSLLSIEQLSGFSSHTTFLKLSKGGETISVVELNELVEQMGKEGQVQIQKRRLASKVRQEDTRKKVVRMGIFKLMQFLKRGGNSIFLLQQFDVDKKGSLSKQQFNSFLISTEIRQFSNRDIRKILIDNIYKYFAPRDQITLQQIGVFFKILPKNPQINPPLNNNVRTKVVEPNPVPAQKKSSESKINNQKSTEPRQIQPKSPEPQPVAPKEVQPKQPDHKQDPQIQCQKPSQPKLEPKHQQPKPSPFAKKINQQNPQISTSLGVSQQSNHNLKQELRQNIFSNSAASFPKAMRFFRLGQPMPSELQVLEQLQDLLRKEKVFEDAENPIAKAGSYVRASEIFQTRFYIFQMAASVLMREKSRIGMARDIEPKDIIQGEAGDCYFLSSIASLISIYPQLIAERFLFQINDSSFYAVRLFIDGEWKTIRTDDRFACKGTRPVYAKPHTNEIWVMLLEKCWAKVYGSYDAIGSGSSKEGFLALTGAPSDMLNIQKENNKEQIAKRFQIAQQKRYVATISGSSYLQSLSSQVREKLGLVSGHAYSFLKMIRIGEERLIKLRNPWGSTTWTGDWSFQSTKWTKQLREKCNYLRSPEDGSFYMSWKQFTIYFSQTIICKLNPTFIHQSIRIRSSNRKSAYIHMTVRSAGQYILSIYQSSKRKYHNYSNYEYSAARLIIMKKNKGKLIYLGAKVTSQSQICSVDVELEQGQYLISAKVVWRHWKDQEFVVTSYGVQKVLFENANREVAPQFKKSLIESYSEQNQGTGKIKSYENYGFKASCETNFSIETGIGYLLMINESDKGFQSTLEMEISGLKLIKPARLPLEFKMVPHSRQLVGFFVNAAGYQSSSSQQIRYK